MVERIGAQKAFKDEAWREKLFQELNEQQFYFVTSKEPSILGIAGPGSGKTRALTYRVANLLQEGVPPYNILLVTFTNKAAEEMKNRVMNILGYLPPGLWSGTFHGIGARILRRHAVLVGREPNFTILDEDDRTKMINSCLASLKVDLKAKEENTFVKRGLLNKIFSSARNTGSNVEDYLKEAVPELVSYTSIFQEVFRLYEDKKRQANAFDFDDLLLVWLELMQANEGVRKRYQEQFKYILVDEFQDTNAIQDRLILLMGEGNAVCLVGDDAQSIYSFRCAEIDNIINFPNKRMGCTVIKLVQNYRSVPEILELANSSIEKNQKQIDKDLYTLRDSGDKPWVYIAPDNYREAEFVAEKVLELYDDGYNLSEIAVLYRSSYLSQDIELALMKRKIPYLTFGGLKFLQRAHIKDILSWLKILENPRDELSWQRVAMMHKGIGNATFTEIWKQMISFPDPLEAVIEGKVEPRRAKQGLETMKETLRTLKQADKDNVPLLIKIIMESPYGDYLREKYPDDYAERSLGIERLAAYGTRCPSLGDFLETLLLEESLIIDSVKESSPQKDFLTLSTIHSAKGKEWGTVLLIGLNEGRFPSPMGFKNMEEERRLFYVAVTRAKDNLYLTAFEEDYRGWGSYISGPSTFLTELSPYCYERLEVEL